LTFCLNPISGAAALMALAILRACLSEISEVLTAGIEVVLAPECVAKSIGFADLFDVCLPVHRWRKRWVLAGFSISIVVPFTSLQAPSDCAANVAIFTSVRLFVSSSDWAASGSCRNTEAKHS